MLPSSDISPVTNVVERTDVASLVKDVFKGLDLKLIKSFRYRDTGVGTAEMGDRDSVLVDMTVRVVVSKK